jgi:hypothetical protein
MLASQAWADLKEDLSNWRERNRKLLESGSLSTREEDMLRGTIGFITKMLELHVLS